MKSPMSGINATDINADDVIRTFLFDEDSFNDEIPCSKRHPEDWVKGHQAVKVIKQFGQLLLVDKFEQAAKLAMSSPVLHSTNTLSRIAQNGTEPALKAAIWFATILFESGSNYNIEFVIRACELCSDAGLVNTVIPHWHSLKIFRQFQSRQMAGKLESIGSLEFAKEIFWKLEMFPEVARILYEQKQYGKFDHTV